jgi:MFS family permease
MNQGVVLQRRGPSLAALLRWSGLALVAAGLLLAVASALHPSRETPATILQAEVRLVAAHMLFTLSSLLVLLGLPGLYGAHSVRMGRLGLVGFLGAFMGTMLVAVSGNFGFLAPVLAAESPQTIDTINAYLPEVALNAVGFGGFVVGFVIFGVAMAKTATLPRSSGLLVAMGAPIQLVGFALAQTVSPALWSFAILGSLALGVGLGWPGYQLWQNPAFAAGPLVARSGQPSPTRSIHHPRCPLASRMSGRSS